jgi:hypothetical protein
MNATLPDPCLADVGVPRLPRIWRGGALTSWAAMKSASLTSASRAGLLEMT